MKQGTEDRSRELGTGKSKKETKQRIENKDTGRARVQVRFCSRYSFSRSPFPVPRFKIIKD